MLLCEQNKKRIGFMMTSKKKYALGKTGIKVASKSEVIVGQTLLIDGYRFVYDKKYPYEDID